jgi:hypothetical protein
MTPSNGEQTALAGTIPQSQFDLVKNTCRRDARRTRAPRRPGIPASFTDLVAWLQVFRLRLKT